MRSILNKMYLYFAMSCAMGVIPRIFGGHAGIHAGGEASLVSGGERDVLLLSFNLALGLATVTLGYAKLPQILAMLTGVKGILLLYLYACASILWSADPTTTFRNIVYLFLYLLSASYIATCFDFDTLIEYIGKASAFFALVSIPAQFLLPPSNYEKGEWAGAFLHKNELGIAMVFGVISLLIAKRPRGLARAIAILLCFALLILSGSAGAYAWALAGVGTLFFLRLHAHARSMLLIVIAGALSLPMMLLRDFVPNVIALVGKDTTLTGRTAVWGVVTRMILAHPLIGYGQGGFWPTTGGFVGTILGTWQPQHAHNGILEICLNLGLVGLCLMLLVLFGVFCRVRRVKGTAASASGIWSLTVTIVVLVHAADEATFLQLNCAWFLFLLASFALWRSEQDIRIGEVETFAELELGIPEATAPM
jgi:exopolysaccharide production protein ExoQ